MRKNFWKCQTNGSYCVLCRKCLVSVELSTVEVCSCYSRRWIRSPCICQQPKWCLLQAPSCCPWMSQDSIPECCSSVTNWLWWLQAAGVLASLCQCWWFYQSQSPFITGWTRKSQPADYQRLNQEQITIIKQTLTLKGLRLLICDWVSMMSSLSLQYMPLRLCETFNSSQTS